jgi:phi13 family phage major tail protein
MAYIGIKDLFIAKVLTNNETSYTTDTPMRLGKAASLKKDYKGSFENSYYDDHKDETVQGLTEKTLEVEVKELTQEVEALLMGQKIVKGMRIESTTNECPDFAVGYRTKVSNGKYEFVWKYVCTAEPFGAQHDTQADKTKINNRTIKFTCRDREIDGEDGVNINETALQTGDTEAKALLAVNTETHLIKWFEEVVEPLHA